MIRRLLGAATAAALIASLSISSVAAAPNPAAVLRASFEAYQTGGVGASYSTFVRTGNGWYKATPTGTDWEYIGVQGASRISMTGGSPAFGNDTPEEHCSSNLFGIWGTWIASKGDFGGPMMQFSFGPAGGQLTPLKMQQTPVKAVVNPQDWLGLGSDFKWFWQSSGVPVYGRLTPGLYQLHVVAGPGDTWDNYVLINDC
jgi:hypothetical protein